MSDFSCRRYALKNSHQHARWARDWAPRCFGLFGDRAVSDFHLAASILFADCAARGCMDSEYCRIDAAVADGMISSRYNLRFDAFDLPGRSTPLGSINHRRVVREVAVRKIDELFLLLFNP